MNCGTKAMKKAMDLGLRAVTVAAFRNAARGVISPVCRASSGAALPELRIMRIPSQIRYKAPAHLMIANNAAGARIKAPNPRSEVLMAMRSPMATPRAVGTATRRPCPMA